MFRFSCQAAICSAVIPSIHSSDYIPPHPASWSRIDFDGSQATENLSSHTKNKLLYWRWWFPRGHRIPPVGESAPGRPQSSAFLHLHLDIPVGHRFVGGKDIDAS